MKKQTKDLIGKLQQKGFHAHYAEDCDLARNIAIDIVGAAATVGIGGSVTIRDLKLQERLRSDGKQIYWHWLARPEDMDEQRRLANQADVYLCSSNALTTDGVFVNTDGNGNRVSAMFQGPAQVILICGENKIVPSLEAAWQRIRNVACPANARRLGLDTPCAVTGHCTDCDSPQRMCNVTTYLERPTHGKQVHVILVAAELGF